MIGTTSTTVDVAAIVTAVFLGIAAVITAISQIKTRREVKDRIGTPNGKGNVVQMSESQLQKLEVLERSSEEKMQILIKMASELGELKGAMTVLTGKLEDDMIYVHRRIDELSRGR